MTVTDLKRILKDWPETNYLGEPTEVWITTGENLSSQCTEYDKLNVRTDETGALSYDILLCPRNYDDTF